MQDREERKEVLTRMQELFQQEGFEDFLGELNTIYTNYDTKLHSVNCENREFWAGVCFGIDEIREFKKFLLEEIDTIEKQEKLRILNK